MKVSFLVTYYNQRQFVKESMESILAIKKPEEWEILVGDDGSTDGTIELVKEYINKFPDHIFLYVMPREQGGKYDSVKRASANRLNILSHSTGDVFCTLDGDDFYCNKEFVNEAIEVFEMDSSVSVVSFGYKYFQDGKYGEDKLLPVGVCGHVDKKTYLKSYYLPAGACVHRKCFGEERVNYIKNIGYFDDNDIVVNSLNYGDMYALNRAIYVYRQTGESVYTSMNAVEQAVLNVQGLDVDLQLIGEEYREDLFERNAEAVIRMYRFRKELEEIVGKVKLERYSQNAAQIHDSLCFSIIDDKLNKSQKKLIHRLEKSHIKYTVKVSIKRILGIQ